MMKICKRKVEMALAKNCMTFTDLSKKMNRTTAHIYIVLSRNTNSPKTIGLFAKSLGVPVTDIIEDE